MFYCFNVVLHYNTILKQLYIFNFNLYCTLTVGLNNEELLLTVYPFGGQTWNSDFSSTTSEYHTLTGEFNVTYYKGRSHLGSDY